MFAAAYGFFRGKCLLRVDCVLYGELEHAHYHVQPEEKSVKTKLLLHLSFPDKWTPEAKFYFYYILTWPKKYTIFKEYIVNNY